MRITSETLQKIARDFVARRAQADRDLLAAYLHGSLLGADPVLGGAADIDVFLVYNRSMETSREIIRLTDDVHLDVVHQPRQIYQQARKLRLDPWLGPTINGALILYDPQHFMDFTQASVRGQYDQPDHIFKRARAQAEQARQVWLAYQFISAEPAVEDIKRYLDAVGQAANAIASLSGPPLTERRFLQEFPSRASAVGHPGLFAGLLGLLGAPRLETGHAIIWLEAWKTAYQAVSAASDSSVAEPVFTHLHPHRLNYYLLAFQASLEENRPQMILWPMLQTWTEAVLLLPATAPEREAWQEAARSLGFLGRDFQERIAGLDSYLDLVEEILEEWARQNGA